MEMPTEYIKQEHANSRQLFNLKVYIKLRYNLTKK